MVKQGEKATTSLSGFILDPRKRATQIQSNYYSGTLIRIVLT